MHIYWTPENAVQGDRRLVASFTGSAYSAEHSDAGLSVFLHSSEPIVTHTTGDGDGPRRVGGDRPGGVVIGGPGPKTDRAMRSGKPTTALDIQKRNEAARKRPAK